MEVGKGPVVTVADASGRGIIVSPPGSDLDDGYRQAVQYSSPA